MTNFLCCVLFLFLGALMKVELNEIGCITDTAITIRGSRRRITVPSEVVDILNLKDGDKLRWIVFNNKDIHLQKVKK